MNHRMGAFYGRPSHDPLWLRSMRGGEEEASLSADGTRGRVKLLTLIHVR